MSLAAALRDATFAPEQRDARGLMPLDDARALIREATHVTRDNLDAVWLALCSLESGEELLCLAGGLAWDHPPRGKENLALLERYGAGLLPWLKSRCEGGTLVNHPWCVLPCLMAMAHPGALELLLSVDGVAAEVGAMRAWQFTRETVRPRYGSVEEDAVREALTWVRRHPDLAWPTLVRLAEVRPRAAEVLRRLATAAPAAVAAQLAATGGADLVARLSLPTHLTVDAILARLDAAFSESWPHFVTGVDGRLEYFALRILGIVTDEGDDWAIVLERLQGCDADSFSVARFAYGPKSPNGWAFENDQNLYESLEFGPFDDDEEPLALGRVVQGPAGPMVLEPALFARHDLRPGLDVEFGGWPERTLVTRAYLAEHPDAFWPPVEGALAAAGLPAGRVLVQSTTFQHCSGHPSQTENPTWARAPSASPAFHTLAQALLARDAALWRPGEPNTDWRLHAHEPNDLRLAWAD